MTLRTPPFLALVGLAIVLGSVAGGGWAVYRHQSRLSPSLVTIQAPSENESLGQTKEAPPVARAPSTTSTDALPQEPAAHLLFVGDIMLDRGVRLRSVRAGTRSYPFLKLPEGWLAEPDFTIGNLEGPVTDQRRSPEKSIDFLFDPEVLPALKNQGFDAFSQANNHALDQGRLGYEDSVRRLREAGFLTFGHQVQDGPIALAASTVQGVRLAFLGWNTTDNPLDREQAREAIQLARQQADHVIAYVHWGPEYRDRPHVNEVALAHWLIDEGVDVIIGGHPHWVQGISSYKGKMIAWSLGNFVFDQDFSVPTKQGLALRLEIAQNTMRVELHPVRITLSQPELEEGVTKQERLEALARISDPSLQDDVSRGVLSFDL